MREGTEIGACMHSGLLVSIHTKDNATVLLVKCLPSEKRMMFVRMILRNI